MSRHEEEAGTPALGSRPGAAPWQARFVEATGTVAVVGATLLLPLHYLGTRVTFFGAAAVVHAEDVRFYWALVGVLTVAVASSFAGALWRRQGDRHLPRHVTLAILGAAAAVAFSVTESGPVQELDRDDPAGQLPPGHDSVCHSGGDSAECAGG
ncbi:hypothetical protein [Nocardioides ferulae]|uniref:hypothetical protein n=1 Tax=Nocardioides ferulae TaxID=2340821 RepID=UPI000EB0400E|nr:hypothetical protein [Nocardioides ferulae]